MKNAILSNETRQSLLDDAADMVLTRGQSNDLAKRIADTISALPENAKGEARSVIKDGCLAGEFLFSQIRESGSAKVIPNRIGETLLANAQAWRIGLETKPRERLDARIRQAMSRGLKKADLPEELKRKLKGAGGSPSHVAPEAPEAPKAPKAPEAPKVDELPQALPKVTDERAARAKLRELYNLEAAFIQKNATLIPGVLIAELKKFGKLLEDAEKKV